MLVNLETNILIATGRLALGRLPRQKVKACHTLRAKMKKPGNNTCSLLIQLRIAKKIRQRNTACIAQMVRRGPTFLCSSLTREAPKVFSFRTSLDFGVESTVDPVPATLMWCVT